MSIVPVESERFEMMQRVADLSYRLPNETAIARELNIPRKVVKELLTDYKTALANDQEARDMARDHLNMMVKHYDSLISKFYDLVDEIDTLSFSHQVAAQKNAALKAIAELDAKRLDALQKAGLLDSADLGDELAEMEEKQAVIIDILSNDLCPQCRLATSTKLTRLTGKVNNVADYDVEVVEHGE